MTKFEKLQKIQILKKRIDLTYNFLYIEHGQQPNADESSKLQKTCLAFESNVNDKVFLANI